MASIPIIIDTDLGDDIDDTWALAMALHSSEVDIRFILTAGPGKHHQRATIAAKVLNTAGRHDIPIGLGCVPTNWLGLQYEGLYQDKWIADYDLKAYGGQIHENGIQAMIDLIMAHEDPVPLTIVAIAPLCNLSEALRIEPAIASKCKFVGMHGSIYQGYFGAPMQMPEYNVIADPASCRTTLHANWISKTLTPLDTCGNIVLRGALYDEVVNSPNVLAREVIAAHRLWHADLPERHLHKRANPAKRSTVLFDCVAIFLAFSEQWLEPLKENATVVVTAEGYTHMLEPSKELEYTDEAERTQCDNVRLALKWTEEEAFLKDLARRIIGPGLSKL